MGAAVLAAAAVVLVAATRAAAAPTVQPGPSRSLGVAFLGPGPKRGALGDSVRSGLEREVRERGGRIVEETSASGAPDPGVSAGGSGLEARVLSSRLEGRDDEQILRFLAAEERDLVIAVGARFVPALARVARDYPRVRFALIGAPRGYRDGSTNAAYLAFDDAQGAFLAGALAARMVAGIPRSRLGFVGGADDQAGRAYQAGFSAGAAYVLPAFRRQGAVIAQYCGRAEAAYSDPAAAEAIAASQYKRGAAIVFHAAGASGQGVYRAAAKAGARAMGSGGDSPGGLVAAATSERGDRALAGLVDELFESGGIKAGARLLGLKEGGVACVPDLSDKTGPAAFAAGLEALRERIVSGEIRVPFDEASGAEFLKSLN